MEQDFVSEYPLIDPELLQLVPEQRAVNERMRAQAASMPRPGSIDAPRLRRARLYNRDGSFKPKQATSARDGNLATAVGGIAVRTFPDPEPHGRIVHFHGGGWVLGSIHEQDDQLASLARLAGAEVVSIGYPLAPEHRLPQILDAGTAALEAVLLQSPEMPVAVMGESAGAHVALNAMLRLSAGYPGRVAATSLAYGIYDLSMTPSQRAWGSEFLGLSTDWLEWFYAQAMPGASRDERSDPAYSPLYRDLSGLPPTQLMVGTCDPLLDDSLFLFQRLRAAGSCARLHVFPDAPHGFNHQISAMADRCNSAVAAFLRSGLVRESRGIQRNDKHNRD